MRVNESEVAGIGEGGSDESDHDTGDSGYNEVNFGDHVENVDFVSNKTNLTRQSLTSSDEYFCPS